MCGGCDVCPFCLQRFSKPTSATGVTLDNYISVPAESDPLIDLQPWVYDDQIHARREASSDELSPNRLFTKKYLNHVNNCSQNTITAITLPQPGDNILKFVNTGSLHDDRFALYGRMLKGSSGN